MRARWLLEAAVGAGRTDVLRHLGTVIHAAAVLAAEGATERAVADRIDEIWHHLDFGSAWYSAKQRALAERWSGEFLDWHRRTRASWSRSSRRSGCGSARWRSPAGWTGWSADDEGRAVIVDLKTGGTRRAEDELGRHPQLGVYQLAVLLGAFERFGLTEPGGAELVQVGKAAGVTRGPRCSGRARWPRTTSLAGPRTWSRRSRRHGRARLRGPGEPGLPRLPGGRLLPGPPRRGAGRALSLRDDLAPGVLVRAWFIRGG